MLKFALLLIYATVEAAYIPVDFFRYPWVSVYHIDSYDDVVSKGLVNFTALGHYGDVDYTGLGQLESLFSHHCLQCFLTLLELTLPKLSQKRLSYPRLSE